MIIGCPATAIPGELVRADKFRVPMITTTSISHPFKGPPHEHYDTIATMLELLVSKVSFYPHNSLRANQ